VAGVLVNLSDHPAINDGALSPGPGRERTSAAQRGPSGERAAV